VDPIKEVAATLSDLLVVMLLEGGYEPDYAVVVQVSQYSL
jgi:hypothetical protein